MPHIVLLGAMGSGKSTLGTVLADALGVLADRREKMVHRRLVPRAEADALNRRATAVDEVAIRRVDTGT